MSDTTQKYVSALWTLIDEVLNSVLFLLIGWRYSSCASRSPAWPWPPAPRHRAGRPLVAVSTPVLLFRWGGNLSLGNVPFLTWAGVRGGISVALALSIPESDAKPAILAATYAVVLFTIVVQGSTLASWRDVPFERTRRSSGRLPVDTSQETDHQRAVERRRRGHRYVRSDGSPAGKRTGRNPP